MKVTDFTDPKLISELENDNVVAIPTETVFGFAIKYDSKTAYKRLIELKHRDFNKPVAMMMSKSFLLSHLSCIESNLKIENVINNLMPGEITILVKNISFPYQTHLGTNVVGIRVPNYEPLLKFLEKLDYPLQVTSANISSNPPLTKVEEIIEQFKGSKYLNYVVNGTTISNTPSTVIDLTTDVVKLIRVGNVSLNQIECIYNNKKE